MNLKDKIKEIKNFRSGILIISKKIVLSKNRKLKTNFTVEMINDIKQMKVIDLS